MELYLIRHPKPQIDAGVCYGQSDIGLAESAEVVAQCVGATLPADFTLYASPLQRARLLAEQLGTPLLEPRLKEIDFGEWELRRFSDIGNALQQWQEDPLGFRAPGGESAGDMAQRVLQWLDEWKSTMPSRPAVVVAHGGPLRVLAGTLLGLAPAHWLTLDFACGHSTRLDIYDWGVLLKWFNRQQ